VLGQQVPALLRRLSLLLGLIRDPEFPKASGIRKVECHFFLDKTNIERGLEKFHKRQAEGEEYKYQGCKGVWNFYELKE
jgi:hypothetical protein